MKKLILSFFLYPGLLLAAPLSLPDNMSVIVMQAKDGKVLFKQQAERAMTPASTTKLLTSYMALKTLGPDFTFKTQLLQADKNIYVKFAGDPSLSSSALQQLLIQALNHQGIKEIQGNLVIDHTVFTGPTLARGWAVDDIPWYYAAPVHGVILDENLIKLPLIPPKNLGEPVAITSPNNFNINSSVTAVDKATAETLCQLDVNQPSPLRFELSGCWPLGTGPQTLRVANQFPLEIAAQTLSSTLKTQGILLKGKITSGKTPSSATVLAERASPPLPALIKEILQNSNNIYTEALTKTLGAKAYDRPTFQAGSYFIEKNLKQNLDLPATQLILFDGSGLSTQNLISANALAQVLRAAYQDSFVKPYFLEALATSGLTGTLKTRFKALRTPFVGKTGSMSHVSTLAGYHGLETGNPLIYVLMINHEAQRGPSLKQQEDRVLQMLVSEYFTSQDSSVKL